MSKINILKTASAGTKKKDLINKIKKEENMVKFTMNMPVYLHQNLKIIAAKKRINMADIVIPFLESYIEKNV